MREGNDIHTEDPKQLLEKQLLDGVTVTLQIQEEFLRFHVLAALDSGFKIDHIARPGETYTTKTLGVLEQEVVNPGFVAISLTKPQEAKDHAPFWKALEEDLGYKWAMEDYFSKFPGGVVKTPDAHLPKK